MNSGFLNKITILVLFWDSIALEKAPVLSLPAAGNKSFSTLSSPGCEVWLCTHQDVNPLGCLQFYHSFCLTAGITLCNRTCPNSEGLLDYFEM
jgi:hypothetical protein